MSINADKLKDVIIPGSKLLCAVSGGADSMCMLNLLYNNRDRLGIDIAVGHFEHGIRGDESLRDADFVEDYCRELGIEYLIGHGDVLKYASVHSLGTEEAARLLRYRFLESAALEFGCDYIATAHNADDNAETVIFNLCRGGGIPGLSGIPVKRDNIIRPMLPFTRAEIEEFISSNRIPYVDDSTNSKDDYSRNVIRHRVMPVLKEINPALSLNVFRSSTILRDDEDYLNSQAERFIEKFYDGSSVPVKELGELHRAVSSRVVRKLVIGSLSYEHVDLVLQLCNIDGLAFADIPGVRIRKEQGRVYFTEVPEGRIPDILLEYGKEYVLKDAGLVICSEITAFPETVHDLLNTFYIKYDEIHEGIVCSSRRPGDRLRIYGRNCSKSLKQLFLEAGYTERQRDITPVFRDSEGVLAVYKLALAERAKPCPGEKAVKIIINTIPEACD